MLKDKLINKLNTPEFANSDDVSTVAVYLETCFDFIATSFSKWSLILFFLNVSLILLPTNSYPCTGITIDFIINEISICRQYYFYNF